MNIINAANLPMLAYGTGLIGKTGSLSTEDHSSISQMTLLFISRCLEYAAMGAALSLAVGTSPGAIAAITFTAVHILAKATSSTYINKMDLLCTAVARLVNMVAALIIPFKVFGGYGLLFLPLTCVHFLNSKSTVENIDKKDGDIVLPHHEFGKAIDEGDEEVAKQILANCVDDASRSQLINGSDNEVASMIYIAIENGNLKMVQFLCENGALINKGGRSFNCALGCALEHKDINMIRFFLAKQAEVPFDLLMKYAQLKNSDLEIILTLAQKCVDFSEKSDDCFCSVLDLVACGYNAENDSKTKEVIELLISKGDRLKNTMWKVPQEILDFYNEKIKQIEAVI